MQTLNFKIQAGALKGIVDLPNFRDDQHIEIAVKSESEKEALTKEDVHKIINELAGCLSNSPDKNKSLDEIRHERIMNKYESLH